MCELRWRERWLKDVGHSWINTERWREGKCGIGKAVRQSETARKRETRRESEGEDSQLQCCDRTQTDTARVADITADISGSATPNSPLGSQQPCHSPPCQSPCACHSPFTHSLSFSPLSSEQRASLHLDRPLIHITPSVPTPHRPTVTRQREREREREREGEREREIERKDRRVRGQRKWGIQGEREREAKVEGTLAP